MAKCNKTGNSKKIFEDAKIAGLKFKPKDIKGKGAGSKPMLWNIHEIKAPMFTDLFLNRDGDTLTDVVGIIGKSEVVKKFKRSYKAMMKSGKKDNWILNNIPDQKKDESDADYKKRVGSVIRGRGIAMHHIMNAYESEANVQKNLGITEEDAESLFYNGTRKLSTVGMYSAIGRDIAVAIGFTVNMDPVANKEYYAELGKMAVDSLEQTGAVKTFENDYFMNNNYMDVMGNSYQNRQSILEGETVAIDLENFIGKGDEFLDQRKEMNSALERNDKDFVKTKNKALNTTMDTAAAIKRITSQSNLLTPYFGESTNNFTTKGLGNVDGVETLGVVPRVAKVMEKLGNQNSQINPVINRLFMRLHENMKRVTQDVEGSINEDATMREVYKMSGISEEYIGALFGAFKNTTADNFKSDMGKSISKESPMFNLINMYGDFVNGDMTSKDFHHELNMYRTTRVEYRATILNEQGDKFFSRSMVTGGEYTIPAKGKVYNHFINGIIDEFNLTKNTIETEGVDPVLDVLVQGYNDIFMDVEGKTDDAIFNEQKSFMVQLAMGEIEVDGKNQPISGSIKHGSVWDLLDAIGAVNSVRNKKNGKIRSTFRTKPDATASGVLLSLLQGVGKTNGPDVVLQMLKDLNITKDGTNKYDDAYAFLWMLLQKLPKENSKKTVKQKHIWTSSLK